MAINYGGKTYNQDWRPINGSGEVLGDKDWAANAAWAAETGGENPYTNAPGASEYDKSGLIPGNEPGSTLPRVTGPTRKAAASQPFNPMPSFPDPPSGSPGDVWALTGGGSGWLPSAPMATKTTNRVSAPLPKASPTISEDGPRRISQGLIDSDTPFLMNDGVAASEDDELERLAKLLGGVLR